jgi:hypothetical protein
MYQVLDHPTPERIERYMDQFLQKVGKVDQALEQLFHTFPSNAEFSDVLLKVVSLNTMYATNIYAWYGAAKRIHALGVDPRLERHDLTLVEDIALVKTADGKTRRNYSFATKYCAWHKLEVYPIYDYFVDHALWHYAKQDDFFGEPAFRRGDLHASYPAFVKTVHGFGRYYSLENFSLRQLDAYLWLYGQELSMKTS